MAKKRTSTTKLTVVEAGAWTDAFLFAKDKGKTDARADKYAAKILERRFPRLKKFAKWS